VAAICFILLLLRAAAPLPGIPVPSVAPLTWCSPHRGNLDRARVLAELKATPGNHLVMVRYGPSHHIPTEWVYNDADIDHAKVVWARDMGPEENKELLAYFKDRQVWVVDADGKPVTLSPYDGLRYGPVCSLSRKSKLEIRKAKFEKRESGLGSRNRAAETLAPDQGQRLLAAWPCLAARASPCDDSEFRPSFWILVLRLSLFRFRISIFQFRLSSF